MGNKYLYWLLIILWGLGILGIQIAIGAVPDTDIAPVARQDNFQVQYELVRDSYQTIGLADYFQQRSLLWTETNKRRNDLFSKLPTITPVKMQQFQMQMLHLLELNPNDPYSLVMAGDYHYFCHQKQTAFWYYQQAYKLAPQSESVNIALADFYLAEWQPERVKELLAGFKSPSISLRMGAACLQSGEYTLALGYLIQADPLPVKWQVIRDKDLYKTYLALGENKQTDLLIKEEYLQPVISGTLFRELKGWSAWLTGDYKAAINHWQAGKVGNIDYKLWDSEIEWLQPDQNISAANASRDFHDSDLNATFKISQGQALYNEGQWSLAYKEYLSAIHRDHRSLVGFLGACTVELCKQDYTAALDLCNQGLAVNPAFGPLLIKRAKTLEKLGRFTEAAKNRVDAGKITDVTNQVNLLHTRLIYNASGQATILVQGETKNLVGFWVSAAGTHWLWYPWWGGPLVLTIPLTRAWVVPTGPGLSGEAFYLENGKKMTDAIQLNPPLLQDREIRVQLPFPAKLIVEFNDHQLLKSYVSDQLTADHRIPVRVFPGGRIELKIRWQNETGLWGTSKYVLDLPESPIQPLTQYGVSTDTLVTNHRQIQLNFASVAGATGDIKVSIGEVGAMTEWQPFRATLNYMLSAGDGIKSIIAQFRDQAGNIQEARQNIELDTQASVLTLLEKNIVNVNAVQLKWSASEQVTSWLRILTDQGNWLEIPVTADTDGIFNGEIPLFSTVFCQIVAKDKAGNVSVTADEKLNLQLRGAASIVFEVNDGREQTNSRWITIKPTSGQTDISWAVSNDLMTWSGWQQGGTALKWRINPSDGEHLVFIKYQTLYANLIHYQVIPVVVETVSSRVIEAVPK
jgi:tetratricopeptide (TPR) repeat protein